MYDVYAIYTNEVGSKKGSNFWQRIGVAFVNRDHSFTVRLNALPLNGVLQIRERARQAEGKGEEKKDTSAPELAAPATEAAATANGPTVPPPQMTATSVAQVDVSTEALAQVEDYDAPA